MKHSILVALLAVFVNIDAWACSVAGDSEETSTAANFAAADHVLVAKIVSARLVRNPAPEHPGDTELVEATYETIELFKGSAEPSVVRESIYGPGNCTLGLTVGNMYLFYLKGAERMAGWPGGSFMLWSLDGVGVVPTLVELRELRHTASIEGAK